MSDDKRLSEIRERNESDLHWGVHGEDHRRAMQDTQFMLGHITELEARNSRWGARIAELETQLAAQYIDGLGNPIPEDVATQWSTCTRAEAIRQAGEVQKAFFREHDAVESLRDQLAAKAGLLAGTNLRWEQTITLYEDAKRGLDAATQRNERIETVLGKVQINGVDALKYFEGIATALGEKFDSTELSSRSAGD